MLTKLFLPVFVLTSVGGLWSQTPPAEAPAKPQPFSGVPKVSAISPAGWHRGATVEVEFTGSRLYNPKGVLFPNTDKIKVTKIEYVPSTNPKVPDTIGRAAKATLEIAPDCPTGLHYARLFTDYGVGDVSLFWVGALPTLPEAEPSEKLKVNNTLETAVNLTEASTINGWLTGDDEDVYKWTAKKGQLLSAEIECARLANESEDGTEILLTIRDASGKILSSCDDTPLFLADPFLSIVAPADGPLFVSVKPLLPASSGRRVPYRLHIGSFERPAGVYPAGGAPGEKLNAQLLGLPAGISPKCEISLPQQPEQNEFAYRAHATTASPNTLRVTPGPNVLEVEPNDDAATATPATGSIPMAFNGILEKDGDVDHFKFKATKGQRCLVSSFAQALGSPADLQIGILPANAKPGQNPEKADDSSDAELNNFEQTYSREKLDPNMIFTAKEDGEYILSVRDVRNSGSPISVYRVEIKPAESGVLAGVFSPDNNARNLRTSMTVGRGNQSLFIMNVRPTFGTEKIDGELKVSTTKLPPGIKFTAPNFKIDQRRIPVLIEAAADAPVGAAMVEFVVEPVTPAEQKWSSVFSHNIGLTYANNEISTLAHFNRLALAVTDEVPFTVKATSPSMPLSRNGELLIDVEVVRKPDYKEPIVLVMENVPQGLVPQTGITLEPDQTKTTVRIGAEGAAPIGAHSMYVIARNKGTGDDPIGKMRASSETVKVEVGEPYVRVKLARSAVERGKKTNVKATIERLRPFPGAATARLIRLPKGLEMAGEPVALSNDAAEFSIELTASADALVGSYPSIACELAVQADGKELKQIVGTGMVRVDPARK